MIHSKNKKSGFTLVEAMIAVAIMGIILTPMFVLETNVFNAVIRVGEQFQRLLFAQRFLYTAPQQEPPQATDYNVEKKEDRPLSLVHYKLTPIAPTSSLASIKRLFKQGVVARGITTGSPQAQLVHFIYKPEPVPS